MRKGYGICLNEWIEDSNIKNELRLLIKISSLSADKGYCFASNEYFSSYFKTSTVTISKQINKLIKLSYIDAEYQREGAVVVRRFLRLKETLMDDYQKLKPTVKENFKDNITSINNTSINKEKEKKFNFRKELLEFGFEEDLVSDWLKVRKDKKASNTKTALNGFINQVEKSNLDKNEILKICVEKSWRSFKASWDLGLNNSTNENKPETAVERLNRELGITK
ncbi:primosomal protein [Polaribacter phage P12002L]|uniref:Replication protein n=2 Tax=Incheonvirus TaxID=2976977 RepID=A0A0F7IJQ2_9CAUD|nr:primosomal protein [Polaribacter phage P12002S]YP_009209704.1 primosomal protein [Polaribacter phage P12002L]AKG94218.1 replication protein [Polaribacter phage P12002L]AKG94299.1 replication protein [Polaribacter phage P12002S]